MAFNPINFAQLSPQRTAMADLFGNILEGYKMGQEPAKLAEERKQAELANAFKQMQLEQQPQLFASQMEGNSLANQQARMNLQNMPMEQQLKMALLQARINQAQNKPQPMTPEEQIAFEEEKAKRIEGARLGAKTEKENEKTQNLIDTWLSEATRGANIINNPKTDKWFGPGFLGKSGLFGSEYRERNPKSYNMNDPDYGILKTIQGNMLSRGAANLSGNAGRILASALQSAKEFKPGFDEKKSFTQGKFNEIIRSLVEADQQLNPDRYGNVGIKDTRVIKGKLYVLGNDGKVYER